ncbi:MULTISPECIES: hypothetical protein [unclassified Corynebacterium]|uniref:hypothetical protein n=1 Tax=unclassified Corynebacterium TaxID=2624378 RepID=UPI00124C2132|nr:MULTISPECIES: hypothetical protein [unclassified Corynebacterium]
MADEADWDVVFECLPSRMAEQLPPSKISQIAGYLGERLAAGWQPGRIREVLDGRALPDQVSNMTGLVIARLRDDVPVDAAPPSRDELRKRRLERRDALLSEREQESEVVAAESERSAEERLAAAKRRRELLAEHGIVLGSKTRRGGR